MASWVPLSPGTLYIPEREDPAKVRLGRSEGERCPCRRPLPAAPGPPYEAAGRPSAGREAERAEAREAWSAPRGGAGFRGRFDSQS